MWSSGGGFGGGGGGFGNDGGGFMSNTQNDFASPAGQVEKKQRRSQNLIPVTLKSIQNCPDDTLRISNTEVHMLTVIGLIKAVDVTSTKITYTIDDSSAILEAVQWLESDADSKDEYSKPLMEMTYCQLFGSMRQQQGKKYIMIFRIVPVEDINLITTHMLEVIHTALKIQKIEKLQEGGGNESVNVTGGGMQNSLMGTNASFNAGNMGMGGGSGGYAGGAPGLSAAQNMVFRVIQQCDAEAGVNRDIIYQSLTGKVAQNEINTVLDFLSSEGHIYSTIDEDHFRTTDGE